MNKIKKVGGRSQRASDSGSGDLGCVGGNLAAARITSWPTEENPPHIRITLHYFLRIGAEYYLNCDCAVGKVGTLIVYSLTLTLGSVRLVHMLISSLVLMSG